jgi:hypothetical protein
MLGYSSTLLEDESLEPEEQAAGREAEPGEHVLHMIIPRRTQPTHS